MREIKFRGIPIGETAFVYGGHCEIGDRHFIIPADAEYDPDCGGFEPAIFGVIEVIPESVGQYTGHTDKNGAEIYGEGDIYKDADGIISIVTMADDGWALFPVKKGTPVRNLYWHNVCNKTKGEVIGNRHQHPELVEDQT